MSRPRVPLTDSRKRRASNSTAPPTHDPSSRSVTPEKCALCFGTATTAFADTVWPLNAAMGTSEAASKKVAFTAPS